MGYQSGMRSRRASGRGDGASHREKAKVKGRKNRSIRGSMLQESHVATLEEVADGTTNRLRNLGNQIFASSPFSEHFDRWLANLTDVLAEFESDPGITVDDQFISERSRILSNVEFEFKERRLKEVSVREILKNLSDNRILLEGLEQEYANRTKEVEGLKNSESKRLSGNINSLREEMHEIGRTKAGIFRSVSKKAKKEKEAEIFRKISTAQSELELTRREFTAELERLWDEHDRKKQLINDQIRENQKEIDNQEIDSSLETRRAACETLVRAVGGLLQRKEAQTQT